MLKKNSFSGGTNGAGITEGNSGGSSGDAFDSIFGAPVYTTTNATGSRAPLVAKLLYGDDFEWSFTLAARTVWARMYIYLPSAPGSDSVILRDEFDGLRLTLSTSRILTITNGGFTPTTYLTATTAIPTGQWCRVEVKFVYGTTTSNGSVELRIYTSADSSTAADTKTSTGRDTGTTPTTGIVFSFVDGTVYFDDLAVGDVDWIGPATVSTTATPSAVAAVAAVDAPTIFTGTARTAAPGAVAAVAAVPAPAASTGQTATPDVVPAVAGLPTATVTVGAVTAVSPTAVAVVAEAAAPVISAGATYGASPVAAVAEVPGPALRVDVSVAAHPLAAVARVPLVTPTVPVLPGDLITGDYQIEFNDQLFGGASVYQILSVEGWDSLVDLDAGNTLRPSRHGAWSGRKLAQERMVGAQILLDDQEAFTASLQQLRRVTAVPDDDSEIELVIRTRGETLVCYGAIDARVIPPDTYYAGVAPASLRWRCSDPRRYGLQVQSVVLSNGASSAAVNDGDTLTHPLVRIAGPAANPSIYNATTDRTLAFTISLASDERLDIDTRLGTVRLGSADRMSALAPLSVPVEEWHLQAGTNIVSYSASSGGSNGVELQFRSAYL